jgi:2-iminobutanoate/2-iminopropanoate deaminase
VAAPIGPYTPVVRAGDFLICSGQLGLAGGVLADGIAAQVKQAIENVAALLEPEGAALSDVVKTLVLLADIDDFAVMNEAYIEAFGDHRPARSAFAVAALPAGGLVEIEAWAYSPAAKAE